MARLKQHQGMTLWRCYLGMGLVMTLLACKVSAAEFDAIIHYAQVITLSTEASGRIVDVASAPGRRITKGEQLVVLDDRRYVAKVKRTQAEKKRAQLHLEEARRELERAEDLFDRGSLAEHDLQVAQMELAEADVTYLYAEEILIDAITVKESTRINAPFDGVILSQPAAVGAMINVKLRSEPLIVVAATDELVARIVVTAEQLSDIHIDQSVMLVVAGQRIKGKVSVISAEVGEQVANRYRVGIRFQSPTTSTIYAGYKAKAILP